MNKYFFSRIILTSYLLILGSIFDLLLPTKAFAQANLLATESENNLERQSEDNSEKNCYRAKKGQPRKRIQFDCPGIEVGFQYFDLDSGWDDWYEVFIVGETWLKDGRSLFFGKFQEVGKFDDWDEQFSIGATTILDKNKRWALAGESSVTPDADFLSEWSVTGRIKYAFTDSFLGEFSFIREEFTRTGVNKEQIRLEKVFGPFQLAYRLELAQVLSGAGDFSNHRIEAKYYYKHGSNVGLQFFFGEIVQDEPNGVFRDNINAWILDGKHLFGQHWGITYGSVLWHHDDRYTRISGKLGGRYEF